MELIQMWLNPSNAPLVIQLILPVVAYLFTYNYTLATRTTVDKGYLVSVFMMWFWIGLLINGYFTLVKF